MYNLYSTNRDDIRNYFYQRVCAMIISAVTLSFFALIFFYLNIVNYIEMSKLHDIEIVANSRINLGEGPFWDIETQSLYYVDIYSGSILRYDYNEKKIYTCKITGESMVSLIVPVNSTKSKDEFVIGAGRKIAVIKWDGKSPEVQIDRVLFQVEDDKPDNRFNDGKCDPDGNLFAGTMRLEILKGDIFTFREGNLYKFSNNDSVTKVKDNVGISNGLDWNTKLKKMYYIDSVDMNIMQYDYNQSTKNIVLKSGKELVHFDGKPEIVPDGMTLDAKGLLYVALHGAGVVDVINPITGKLVDKIKFPSKLVTSCAFGGPNLDELFVTSAHKGKEDYPGGSLYIVKGLNAKGLPMTKYNLN